MLEAIHASHNGNLYRVQLRDRDDIADLVREHRLETVGSRDNSARSIFVRSRISTNTSNDASRIASWPVPFAP